PAVKSCIDVGAGVIDPDYQEQIKVLLIKHGTKEFKVHNGERRAQLILEQALSPYIIYVPELDETLRGRGGFGSTGNAEIVKVGVRSICAVADSTLLIFPGLLEDILVTFLVDRGSRGNFVSFRLMEQPPQEGEGVTLLCWQMVLNIMFQNFLTSV